MRGTRTATYITAVVGIAGAVLIAPIAKIVWTVRRVEIAGTALFVRSVGIAGIVSLAGIAGHVGLVGIDSGASSKTS